MSSGNAKAGAMAGLAVAALVAMPFAAMVFRYRLGQGITPFAIWLVMGLVAAPFVFKKL